MIIAYSDFLTSLWVSVGSSICGFCPTVKKKKILKYDHSTILEALNADITGSVLAEM